MAVHNICVHSAQRSWTAIRACPFCTCHTGEDFSKTSINRTALSLRKVLVFFFSLAFAVTRATTFPRLRGTEPKTSHGRFQHCAALTKTGQHWPGLYRTRQDVSPIFFSNFSSQDLKNLLVQTNNTTTRPKTEESDFPRRLGSWSCSHTGEKVLEMCLILEVLEKSSPA